MGKLTTSISFTCYLLVLSVSISAAWILNADENATANETVYRLPETLVPTAYDLLLTIEPANNTFKGSLNIIFDVEENVTINDISLHFDSNYITVDLIKLNAKMDCTAGIPNAASISIVKCTAGISGRDNILYIEYTALYSTDGYGVVKGSYLDNGKEETIIQSVFEPVYARRAFPCFDEPALRAHFSLQINHPAEYSVISNSPVIKTVDSGDNSTTTRFDATPKISTHLLSFIISKLHSIEVISNERCDLKIFTRADLASFISKVEKSHYSKIIDHLGNYSGVLYQDIEDRACYQVAVPEYSDTIGGFGLFKYSEVDLLDDGHLTSGRTVQDILTNIAHNFAHQWYGGALAVSWWSDIWSNEAVATYLSYTVTDYITNNEFDLKNQFVAEVVRKSLQTDAYSFAQPLSFNKSDVNDVDSITKRLDRISYQKGASILRMIGYMIGDEDTLRQELGNHLLKRKETTTDGSNLIKDLTEGYSTKYDDLNAYLQSWIFSPGYPLLTAKIINVTGIIVDDILVNLSQKRFMYPTNDMQIDNSSQWAIPYGAATNGEEFYIRVEEYYKSGGKIHYSFGNESYCIFNVQSGFFYRVNYDETMWKRIISALKNRTEMTIIDPLTRAQLIDDVFNIARTGEVSYNIAFQLVDFLESDTDYYSWYAAFDAFSYLIGKTGSHEAEENLRIYILRLMEKVLKELNKKTRGARDAETHIEVLRRVLVTKWACKLNRTETVKSVVDQFENIFVSLTDSSDQDLRAVIYCNGIRYSEDMTVYWRVLWDRYSSNVSRLTVHQKEDTLTALGCCEDKDILKSYLLKIITPDSGIRGESAITVFKSVFSSSAGIPVAMSFLDSNITEVVALGKNIWPEILYTLAEQLFTDEHLNWINEKLDNKIFDGHDDIKFKIRTLTSVNNYWVNNFQVYVKEILLNNLTTTTSSTTTSSTTTSRTTTQETPTTTGAASSVVFSNIVVSVIILTILVSN